MKGNRVILNTAILLISSMSLLKLSAQNENSCVPTIFVVSICTSFRNRPSVSPDLAGICLIPEMELSKRLIRSQ